MKEYALYDVKDYEQCVYFGTIKDIAKYLKTTNNSLRSYMSQRKKGRRVGLLKKRYLLEEIYDEEIEAPTKSSQEFFNQIIEIFKPKKIKFEIYDERKYLIDNKVYIEIQNEIWKDIEGSTYQISNYGRIKNMVTDKILYGKLDRGTLRVKFSIKGMIKSQSIARIVAKVFLGGITDNQTIIHKDGNALNNKVDNLLIIDKKEKYKMMGKQSGEKRKQNKE